MAITTKTPWTQRALTVMSAAKNANVAAEVFSPHGRRKPPGRRQPLHDKKAACAGAGSDPEHTESDAETDEVDIRTKDDIRAILTESFLERVTRPPWRFAILRITGVIWSTVGGGVDAGE